jgi:hypothetical protein
MPELFRLTSPCLSDLRIAAILTLQSEIAPAGKAHAIVLTSLLNSAVRVN